MFFQSALRIALLALAVAGFAGAAQAKSPHMMTLGAGARAPGAFIAFCSRQAEVCGPDAAAILKGAAAPVAPVAELVSAKQLMSTLVDVNGRVNQAIRPVKDAAGPDRWSLPLAEGRNTGDCEDYALTKRQELLARGIDRSALNLAIATTPKGEVHAVLLVSTADGEYVLDNLDPVVRRWDDVPYRWSQRQVEGRTFQWAKIANG